MLILCHLSYEEKSDFLHFVLFKGQLTHNFIHYIHFSMIVIHAHNIIQIHNNV